MRIILNRQTCKQASKLKVQTIPEVAACSRQMGNLHQVEL